MPASEAPEQLMDVLKRATEWIKSRWDRPALRITTHQDSVWVRLNSLLVRDDIGAFRAATDGLPTHEHKKRCRRFARLRVHGLWRPRMPRWITQAA